MKRFKLFVLFIALTFVGVFSVSAKEVTVCKSGCDYTDFGSANTKVETGSVVKLKEDSVFSPGGAVVIRPDMTLDLGGFTLTVDNTLLGILENNIVITNGTLDLKGSSSIYVLGSAKNGNKKTSLLIDKNLTINSENAEAAIAIIPNGSTGTTVYNTDVDIKGKINSNKFSITIHGDQKAKINAPIVNIYATASLKSKNAPAIYGAGYGTWNIDGGVFEGTEALSVKSGIYNITGGSFIAIGEFVDPAKAYNNGSECTGAAISITKNPNYVGDIEMNISNVEVNSKNGYAIYEAISVDANNKPVASKTAVKTLNVTSGTFSGAKGSISVQNITGFVVGGTYNSNVKKYIANKYIVNNVDNKYVVEENKVVETNNKNVKFESEDAFLNSYKLIVSTKSEEEIKDIASKIKEIYAKNNKLKDANLLALYEIHITDGTEIIPMNNGKFTISIAIDKSLQKYQTYKVIYVDNNGVQETLDAKLVDGKVVFETTHLSTYGIVGYNNVTVTNPNTFDSISIWLIISSFSLVFGIISAYKLKKNA